MLDLPNLSHIDNFSPELTVLLPVYNGIPYLEESIKSILDQTFTNFELIIIDDGSTDQSRQTIELFASLDSRIKFFSRENRGLIATLNQGLMLSRANMIARMDADDIALPHRLEHQMLFMKANPHIDVCGSGLICYETGKEWFLPEEYDALHALALFNTPVYHPTVIMRKNSILEVGGYSICAQFAEDYDLWVRMLNVGMRFANLREILLKYRIHPEINRTKYHTNMAVSTSRIQARQLNLLGLPTDKSTMFLHRICCVPCRETAAMHTKIVNWLKRIKEVNHTLTLYPQEAMDNEIARRIQSFGIIQPLPQPSRWIFRQLRHCIHILLLLVSERRRITLEAFLTSYLWKLSHFYSKIRNRFSKW